jgi:hypothetical protein
VLIQQPDTGSSPYLYMGLVALSLNQSTRKGRKPDKKNRVWKMQFKNSISGVVLTTVLIQQPDTGSNPHLYMGLVALSLNQRTRKMSSLLPVLMTSQGRKARSPAWAVDWVLGTKNMKIKIKI